MRKTVNLITILFITAFLSSYEYFTLIFGIFRAFFLVYIEWLIVNILQKVQNYKTNIGAIIRDSEMLRNDPNYLKTKDV